MEEGSSLWRPTSGNNPSQNPPLRNPSQTPTQNPSLPNSAQNAPSQYPPLNSMEMAKADGSFERNSPISESALQGEIVLPKKPEKSGLSQEVASQQGNGPPNYGRKCVQAKRAITIIGSYSRASIV